MKYMDLHCDTISTLLYTARAGAESPLPTLQRNDFHIDLQKLKAGGCFLQTFALFCDTEASLDPLCDLLAQAELFWESLEKYGDRIAFASSPATARKNEGQGKINAVLSIEDSGPLASDLALLSLFHRLGVRMATLTWNHKNALAFPRGADGGLTPRGLDFIEEMQRLGILLDLSHLSDFGILQALSHAKGPVVASHSNARTLCPHPRNLTDEMIRKIGERGGLIGLNLYPPFLSSVAEKGGLDALCAHAVYLSKMGGTECVALGTDFDGFGQSPDFQSARDLAQLPDALRRHGFTTAQVEQILYGNAWRVFKEVL